MTGGVGYYAVFVDRDQVGYVICPGGCVNVLFLFTVTRWALTCVWWVCNMLISLAVTRWATPCV